MEKSNNISIQIIFAILIFLCLIGCGKMPNRDFFNKMQTKYPSLKSKNSAYVLNSFGLEGKAKSINGKYYWELTCDGNSFFYLAGYLRYSNDKIYFLPLENRTSNLLNEKEQIIYNFSSNTPGNWKLLLNTNGNLLAGDSIVLRSQSMSATGVEYYFDFYPFEKSVKTDYVKYENYFYRLKVSKNEGITEININYISGYRPLYHITLFPKVSIKEEEYDDYSL